jgi:hypothetical protein
VFVNRGFTVFPFGIVFFLDTNGFNWHQPITSRIPALTFDFVGRSLVCVYPPSLIDLGFDMYNKLNEILPFHQCCEPTSFCCLVIVPFSVSILKIHCFFFCTALGSWNLEGFYGTKKEREGQSYF